MISILGWLYLKFHEVPATGYGSGRILAGSHLFHPYSDAWYGEKSCKGVTGWTMALFAFAERPFSK